MAVEFERVLAVCGDELVETLLWAFQITLLDLND